MIEVHATARHFLGMPAADFLRDYWQKRPLLIRNAFPGYESPLQPEDLAGLACEDGVLARLIEHDAASDGWRVRHGPFAEEDFPGLPDHDWTLLVQDMDKWDADLRGLLDRFDFLPRWRIDDVMVSFAATGGSVGAHVDQYDVFLLQAQGHRRWQIDASDAPPLAFRDDVELKLLRDFHPDHDWVLTPGDMLYLPPGWAHDGIAQGECMTCSIGFRVPEGTDLAREVLIRWMEGMDTIDKPRLYQDPKQAATSTPGLIPDALRQFTADAVARLMKDPAGLQSALGEILTEPKPRIWFQSGEPLPDGAGVRLDPRTRMMYDEQRVFANGESWRAGGKDARHLRQLADQRFLTASVVAQVSEAVRELLNQWAEDGWLHPLA